MTKEELKKEAEEWIKDYKDHSGLCGSYMFVNYDYNSMQKAYLAGVKPREKRIAELEKEYASLKGLRKYELNVAKLEIEKLEKENKALIKAKELLKWALHSDPEHDEDFDQKWEEAEQFLKQE